MARYTPNSSPKGFWPNPDQEPFFKNQTPPWVVPKRRNTRGEQTRLYTLNSKNESGKEVITTNRFSLLNNNESLNEYDYMTINDDDKKKTQERKPANCYETSNYDNDFSAPIYNVNNNLFSEYNVNFNTVNLNKFDNRFAYVNKYVDKNINLYNMNKDNLQDIHLVLLPRMI